MKDRWDAGSVVRRRQARRALRKDALLGEGEGKGKLSVTASKSSYVYILYISYISEHRPRQPVHSLILSIMNALRYLLGVPLLLLPSVLETFATFP